MSKIPYGTFLAWNAAGGALWAGGFVLLGYAAGSQYQTVAHNASIAGFGLLAVVLVVIAVRVVRSRRRERAGSAA